MKRFKAEFIEAAGITANEGLRNMLYLDEDEECPVEARNIKFEILPDGRYACTSTQIMSAEFFEEAYLPTVGYESLDQVMEEQP